MFSSQQDKNNSLTVIQCHVVVVSYYSLSVTCRGIIATLHAHRNSAVTWIDINLVLVIFCNALLCLRGGEVLYDQTNTRVPFGYIIVYAVLFHD